MADLLTALTAAPEPPALAAETRTQMVIRLGEPDATGVRAMEAESSEYNLSPPEILRLLDRLGSEAPEPDVEIEAVIRDGKGGERRTTETVSASTFRARFGRDGRQ